MKEEHRMKRKTVGALKFIAPLTACMRSVVFHCLLLAVSGYLIYDAYTIINAMSDYGVSRFRAFRLDIVELNQNPAQSSRQEVRGILLQLTYRGCVAASQNITFTDLSNGTAMPLILLPSSLAIDGFTVSVVSGKDMNRALFKLLGSNDDGLSWNLAGTSRFRYLSTGVRFMTEGSLVETRQTHDFRAPWPVFQESAIDSILLAIGCLGVCLCAVLNNHDEGVQVLMYCTVLLAVNNFAAAVGLLVIGMDKYAFLAFASSAIYWLLFVSLSWAQRYFFDCLFFGSVVWISCRVISDCTVFDDCSNFSENPPLYIVFFGMLGLTYVLVRHRSLFQSFKAVKKDQELYDSQWQILVSDPVSCQGLEDLGDLTDAIEAKCVGQPRQYNRQRLRLGNGMPNGSGQSYYQGSTPSRRGTEMVRVWEEGGSTRRSISGERGLECFSTFPGSIEPASPVSSLDQLYHQAVAVVDVLHGRCVEWAASSRGVLDCEKTGQEVSRDSSSMQKTLRKWLLQGTVKAPTRAIEKALVCYAGDVSKLVDICRARLLFDEVQDVLACLQIIQEQALEVKIVRIKNSMRVSHDSGRSAGFRVRRACVEKPLIVNVCLKNYAVQGVILNLRFDTETTRSFGVECHVCEVQLVLKRLVQIEVRSDLTLSTRFVKLTCFTSQCSDRQAMHSRYLKFRAARDYSASLGVLRRSNGMVWPLGRKESFKGAKVDVENPPDSPPLSNEDGVMTIKTLKEIQKLSTDMSFVNQGSILEAGAEGVTSMLQLEHVVYLRSALSAGGEYDRRALRLKEAFALSSAGSAWFSSKPLAAASSKPLYHVVLLCMSAFFFYSAIDVHNSIVRFGSFQASSFRFRALELRDRNISAEIVQISSFGLLKDGCQLSEAKRRIGNTDIEYDSVVDGNGFFFVTSAGPAEYDPVRWIVEGSADNGSSWQTVGSSGMMVTPVGTAVHLPQLVFATPDAREQHIDFDLRPDWPDILLASTGGFEWAFCLVGSAVAGMSGAIHMTKILFGMCILLDAVFISCAIVGFHAMGHMQIAIFGWMTLFAVISLGMGFTVLETKIVHMFFLYSFAYAMALIIYGVVLYPVGWDAIPSSVGLSPSSAAFAFGCIIVFFRSRVLIRARRLVMKDMVHYDQIWSAFRRSEETQRELLELQTEVQRLRQSLMAGAPRQYNRLKPSCIEAEDEAVGVPCSLDLARPLSSLDQLFVQAVCLYPILLDKVKAWAALTGGCFPLVGTQEYVRFAEAQDDPDVQIQFGKIKTVARSLEKAYRSYKQDMSLLVDVCRQSIAFESLAELTACLRAIAADSEVTVVRVKNRLDPAYDSADSAGYRDVALNLRIVSAAAQDLGVETHVCEVQLLLKSFAELKSDDGHKRYVAFRNLIGK